MLFNGGARSVLVRGGLVLLVACVGVLAGHFLWSAASTIRLSQASSRSFGPFGYARPGGAVGSAGGAGEDGGGRYGSGGGLFGPGGGSGKNGNSSGEGAGAGSGSAGGVSGSITTKVDPALVDINTDLGLEGGE